MLPRNEPVRFLALGDSYTIGEGVPPLQRWPAQLINALMLKGYTCHEPEIVAMTGWRTDDLMGALAEKELPDDFNLVSLLIGVNNQYQRKSVVHYRRDFELLLQRAINFAGGNKDLVFVLSIPDYGYTPFGESKQSEISKEIDAFNEVNESVSRQYGVRYVQITDISRQASKDTSLLAEDGLHPSGTMYAMWVDRILQSLLK